MDLDPWLGKGSNPSITYLFAATVAAYKFVVGVGVGGGGRGAMVAPHLFLFSFLHLYFYLYYNLNLFVVVVEVVLVYHQFHFVTVGVVAGTISQKNLTVLAEQ